jgi:dolichol-phosphate mannosyltransferase
MKKPRLPHIEIIIPIFNEVKILLSLIKELDAIAEQLKTSAVVSYLFVNDGSHDGSTQLLHRIFREREDLRVIDLVHSFGHTAAVACGLEHFQGDIALVFDADLRDAPVAVEPLFKAWLQGAKTVIIDRVAPPESRSITAKLGRLLFRGIHDLPPFRVGSHCLLDRSVVRRLKGFKERTRSFPGLVSTSSGDIWRVKAEGRKSASPVAGNRDDFRSHLDLVLGFSRLPFHLLITLGLICIACGAAGIVFFMLLIGRLALRAWVIFFPLAAIVSGIQFLALGLVGEYVYRILQEVKQRPLYLVERVLDKHPSEKTHRVAV